MSLIFLEYEGDPPVLGPGFENIDTGIVGSGHLGLATLPVTGGDIYVSGQNVRVYAVDNINLRGRTTLGNNRNNVAPLQFLPQAKVPASTNEGELIFAGASSRVDAGMGRLFFDTGSGIATLSVGSGYFFAMDNLVGGDGVRIASAAAGTTLGFNTVMIKDIQYQHIISAAASGIITVTQDGLYEISYSATFVKTDTGTTVPTTIKTQLARNNSAYSPSSAYDINANNTNPNATCVCHTMMLLQAGDQITLRARKETNATAVVRTNNGEVWILIKKLR